MDRYIANMVSGYKTILALTNLPQMKSCGIHIRERCDRHYGGVNSNTGNEENLKTTALFNEIYRTVKPHLSFNAIELFEAALRSTRIKMSPAAKRQFFEKHIQQMKLIIDDNGNVTVELNQK